MCHRKLGIRSSVGFIALAAAFTGMTPSRAETLTVQLKNVRSAKGEVQFDVYTVARKRVAKKRIAARPGTTRVEFPDLPAGAYGVYVYHDENGNGKLDTGGLLSLPIEGYAFSNDASASFGPPSIEDLKVVVPRRGAAATTATMKYRRRG